MHTTHILYQSQLTKNSRILSEKAPPSRQHKVDSGYLLLHPISTCHDLKPSHDPRFTWRSQVFVDDVKTKELLVAACDLHNIERSEKKNIPRCGRGMYILAKVSKDNVSHSREIDEN